MLTPTPAELKKILDDHAKWRAGDSSGIRANLGGANLYGANLGGADLSGADLHGANLYGANLGGAYLYGANLGGADLNGADLGGADLNGANLYGANLGGANLNGANLNGANLNGANLGVFAIVPPTGAFDAWKAVSSDQGRAILRLSVPADAARVSTPMGRKCRASSLMVMEVFPPEATGLRSQHDPEFRYVVGERATAPSYDPSIQIECTAGLHFFLTREEAEAYGR